MIFYSPELNEIIVACYTITQETNHSHWQLRIINDGIVIWDEHLINYDWVFVGML